MQSWRDSILTSDSSFQVSGWLSTPIMLHSGPASVIERPWHGWRVSVGYVPLDMAEAAVLASCTDLLGDRWMDVSPPAPSLVAVRATRWPARASGDENLIDWPWVSHSTFWAYERALAWLKQADKAWVNQPDAAFGSWVAVMTAQLFDAPDLLLPFDHPIRPFVCDWTSLAERLMTLDVTPLGQAWLNAVGLLCTPEMGMTSHTNIPPLLPPERAKHVQSLRTMRATKLLPPLQKLAKSWAPTAEQPAKQSATKGTESASSRVRARRPPPAPRGAA